MYKLLIMAFFRGSESSACLSSPGSTSSITCSMMASDCSGPGRHQTLAEAVHVLGDVRVAQRDQLVRPVDGGVQLAHALVSPHQLPQMLE